MKTSKAEVEKRRIEIMKEIEEKTSVSVEELSAKFEVSPVTIRRDLQYWEDKGAIEKNYGGATLIQAFVEDKDYDKKRYMRAIAKKAAEMVEDDDVIFINSSRTALMVVDYIKNKRATIITNNARAINYTPAAGVSIIFTGGEVKFPKNSMTGEFAISTLNSITANKCFIGCSGLSEKGISTGLMKETLINKTMLRRTKGKRVVLCDAGKIGLRYNFDYSNLEDIDLIITDVRADDEVLDNIARIHDVTIHKVEPIRNTTI
ncbi:MAG: DeoR/GlpR family DNA-binding transcription regulator [Erysipelotrichaceae bacterium]|nr:DeoR/GlpR family DNA-binding transcription regulator [Erysipelotrichaceae bacterium]